MITKIVRERDIEKYLVKQVKAAGGEVRKVAWINRRGAPDRYVMMPGASAWVEIKAPGIKAEAYQIREHTRMAVMGQYVWVIDSTNSVDDFMDLYA